MVFFILSTYMTEWLLTILSTIKWFFQKYAEMTLDAYVISLCAIMYWIRLTPSIELMTIAWSWSIFGKTWFAVVSAELMPWAVFFLW